MEKKYHIENNTVQETLIIPLYGRKVYLDKRFEEHRNAHPGKALPVWDTMRDWALPVIEKADSYKPQRSDDAKEKSREYFNTHKSSKLAHAGYWKHDYKYALAVIKRINPDNLIDIGCGPGAFLEEVHRNYADIKLSALDLSEEMIEVTKSRLFGNVNALVGDLLVLS